MTSFAIYLYAISFGQRWRIDHLKRCSALRARSFLLQRVVRGAQSLCGIRFLIHTLHDFIRSWAYRNIFWTKVESRSFEKVYGTASQVFLIAASGPRSPESLRYKFLDSHTAWLHSLLGIAMSKELWFVVREPIGRYPVTKLPSQNDENHAILRF